MTSIDSYVKASSEDAKEALKRELALLWEASQAENAPHKFVTLFEYGNQQSLIASEFDPRFVKFFHDDFLYDRAASFVIKEAIKEFLLDKQISQAIFYDISLGQKKAMQTGFLSDAPGARMNVGPIERAPVTQDELKETVKGLHQLVAAEVDQNKKLKLQNLVDALVNQADQSTLIKLTGARKGLSQSAVFTSRITPQKLEAAPEVTTESTKKPGF